MSYLDEQYLAYRARTITEDVFFARLRKVFLRITRDEDIVSDAILQILNEIRAGKNFANFSAYANLVIQNDIKDARRKEMPLASAEQPRAASEKPLVGQVQSVPASQPTPSIDAVLAYVQKHPSGRLRTIVDMLLAGHTQTEIAQHLGLSQVRVHSILRDAGKKISK
ncbi:MAG TPA: sigma-70 family RNA polymerase sigma factor [Acidobacteriaceae bacterium]|nr:sigma-70 family RNA polymerase sigma factor [Acidobacteriaceae bacterium]